MSYSYENCYVGCDGCNDFCTSDCGEDCASDVTAQLRGFCNSLDEQFSFDLEYSYCTPPQVRPTLAPSAPSTTDTSSEEFTLTGPFD
jgi:hypothetical protein